MFIIPLFPPQNNNSDHRGRMVVGFTTTYVIRAYHHWCCESESRSGQCVQHYVIKFISDLPTGRWFSPGPSVSSTNKTDRHDITEILLKVALNIIKQTKPPQNIFRYIHIYKKFLFRSRFMNGKMTQWETTKGKLV